MNNLKQWAIENEVDYDTFDRNEYDEGDFTVTYEYINFKGKEYLLKEIEKLSPWKIVCGNIAIF